MFTSNKKFWMFVSGVEAHGGYTFCGYAALVLLGEENQIDVKKLLVSNGTEKS